MDRRDIDTLAEKKDLTERVHRFLEAVLEQARTDLLLDFDATLRLAFRRQRLTLLLLAGDALRWIESDQPDDDNLSFATVCLGLGYDVDRARREILLPLDGKLAAAGLVRADLLDDKRRIVLCREQRVDKDTRGAA